MLLGRFKIRGRRVVTVDAPEFKEAEHPRDKTGKFTSGGAHGKQISNGITAPKVGSQSHNIWTMAAHLHEQGKPINAKSVMEMGTSKGHNFTPATVGVQLGHFKKFMAGGEEAQKPQVKPKLPDTVETFENLASAKGYSKEGTYNGKAYYKNSKGVKLSYDPAANTWAHLQPGKLPLTGSGMNTLSEHIGGNVDPSKVTAVKPKPAPPPPPPDPYSVKGAAVYASKKVQLSTFSFTTKGAPTETALPTGVRDAIKAYRGANYQEINHAIRFSADFENVHPETLRQVLNLTRAFQMAPPTTNDIEVVRRVKLDALKAMVKHAGLNNLKDLQPGNILREEGIVSTSHGDIDWIGDVRFEIKVPKGSKAIDLSETINKAEKEMILPPGTNLRVVSVKEGHNNAKFHIQCEVVQ